MFANVGLIFKLMSPFHDSEKAWQDSKAAGLNPLLQAKVIGLVLSMGAIAAQSLFNVVIPPDQVSALAAAIVGTIKGVIVIYGIVMYVSDAWFKAHPKVCPKPVEAVATDAPCADK